MVKMRTSLLASPLVLVSLLLLASSPFATEAFSTPDLALYLLHRKIQFLLDLLLPPPGINAKVRLSPIQSFKKMRARKRLCHTLAAVVKCRTRNAQFSTWCHSGRGSRETFFPPESSDQK